jgi:hypothetical protein
MRNREERNGELQFSYYSGINTGMNICRYTNIPRLVARDLIDASRQMQNKNADVETSVSMNGLFSNRS